MASSKTKSSTTSMATSATTATSSTNVMTEETERRKTFAYKMSKKVAELTQVVHILFVKNHEKEVQMAALINAYEHEIDLVISDAQSKLINLENQLQEAREAGTRLEAEFNERLGQALARNDEQWKLKVQSVERQLESNDSGSDDDLRRVQSQLDHVIAERAADSTRHARDLDEKCRELERLKLKMAELEKIAITDLTRRETLESELSDVKQHLMDSNALKDSLLTRSRRLEDEVSNLRRQQQRNKERGSLQPPQDSCADELDRLRQEIRHLKMELGNRETNFNRLFTAHQPVYLTQSMKQRTDLNQPQQQLHGDSSMTSSRYYSAASGRSAIKLPSAGLRLSTDIAFDGNNGRKQSVAETVSSVTSSDRLATISVERPVATEETLTRISFETVPQSDCTVSPPGESLYNGLPILVDKRRRRNRQPPVLAKPSIPLLAKAR